MYGNRKRMFVPCMLFGLFTIGVTLSGLHAVNRTFNHHGLSDYDFISTQPTIHPQLDDNSNTSEQTRADRYDLNAEQKKDVVNTSYTASMSRIQQDRHLILRRACIGLENRPNIDGSNLTTKQLAKLTSIHVIPELKLLYCYVPKTGCTSWKSLLLRMTGHKLNKQVHERFDSRFPSLATFDLEEVQEIVSKYRSFLFVRNPFTRILSAYRDKITLEGKDSFRNLLLYWITRVDPVVAASYKAHFRNFTYTQFIRYYLSSSPKNEHWREIYKLCAPCQIRYDFIGMFDYLQEDSAFLIKTLGADQEFKLPSLQKKTNSSSNKILVEFYKGLPRDWLMKLVQDRGIATDMELFGFEIPAAIQELINDSMTNRDPLPGE